jgi:hypothetical protein
VTTGQMLNNCAPRLLQAVALELLHVLFGTSFGWLFVSTSKTGILPTPGRDGGVQHSSRRATRYPRPLLVICRIALHVALKLSTYSSTIGAICIQKHSGCSTWRNQQHADENGM